MDSVQLSTALAAISAIASCVAAIGALLMLWPARRSAEAAREQTTIQQELRRQAAQPYVWADIRPATDQKNLLAIVVGNSGPTTACNVRVQIRPPLPPVPAGPAARLDRSQVAQERLTAGVRSLAPGRQLSWCIGLASDRLAEPTAQAHLLTITAEGPFGPLDPVEVDVRCDDWRETRDAPQGSLHLLTQEVANMRSELSKTLRSIERATLHEADGDE